jgi:hypothetical protein
MSQMHNPCHPSAVLKEALSDISACLPQRAA